MEKNNHANHGAGFLFGLLVGVALTLLLTTKKGRRMLKIVTEEGIDKLSEWEDMVKDVKSSLSDEDDFVQGDDYVVPQERETVQHDEEMVKKETVHHVEKEASSADVETPVHEKKSEKKVDAEDEDVHKVKSTARRFFRGVKRG